MAHEWEKGRVRKSAKLYGKLLPCVPSIFVHTSSLIELKRKKKKVCPLVVIEAREFIST